MSTISSSKKGASPLRVFSLAFMALILILGSVSAVTFPTFYQNNNNNGNGSNETLIVVGSNAAQSDRDAAETIANAIRGNTGSTGNGSSGNGGDAFLIQRTSNNLNMGESITDIYTAVDNDQLPSLLADNTFTTGANDEYDYEQRIDFAPNLTLQWFENNQLENGSGNNPQIGIYIPSDQPILNYTLDFRQNAESALTGSNLVDFQDSDLTILGTTYTILRASINPNTLELIGGASTDLLNEGETGTYMIDGQQVQVIPQYINSNQVRLQVNGELSNSLQEGDTYRVGNGVRIGVRNILYNAKESGVSQVEITIGAQDIRLRDGQNVEVNGDEVDNLTSSILMTGTGDTRQLERIILSWTPSDDAFVTANSQLPMPAFENLKLSMADFVTPSPERLEINPQGNDRLNLRVNVADGDYNLPILSGNGTGFTVIGRDANNRLATSTNNTLVFDTDTDDLMVASWTNNNDAESYIMQVSSIRNNDGQTEVTVRNAVSGDSETERVGGTIDMGNVELTVQSANATTNTATFVINSGGNFNRLYTKQGLTLVLPVDTTSPSSVAGGINLAASPTTYPLQFVEEDEDDNVGQGASFNVTTSWSGGKAGLSGTGGVSGTLSGDGFLEIGDTNRFIAYVQSPLSTRIEINTDADPDTGVITYYGSETYGRVYIGGSNLPSGNSTSRGNVRIVSDSNTANFGNAQIISVGGSCVNRVTAQALGLSFSTCGQEFTDETDVGQGEYLVQTVRSPFASGNATARTLTIVAGYDAADTTRAASEFDNIDFDIQAGNRYNSGSGNSNSNNNRTNG